MAKANKKKTISRKSVSSSGTKTFPSVKRQTYRRNGSVQCFSKNMIRLLLVTARSHYCVNHQPAIRNDKSQQPLLPPEMKTSNRSRKYVNHQIVQLIANAKLFEKKFWDDASLAEGKYWYRPIRYARYFRYRQCYRDNNTWKWNRIYHFALKRCVSKCRIVDGKRTNNHHGLHMYPL